MSDSTSALALQSAREKYRAERNKRLRLDGLDQYRHLEGALSRFAEDPWVEGDGARSAVDLRVDAVILGAGLASLMQAVSLHGTGLERVMMIDKAGDVGGTWYWNRYPGAQCDTESYVYLPFLEETGYTPTEKYAHQPEILEHCKRIARHFGLYEHALFQTQITESRWDDVTSEWVVTTNRGDSVRARYFVIAPGRLQSIKLPGIEGIESFQGRAWHTSRWDQAYTGADLSQIADKRIGIVGTGATGIQVVPHLAEAAKEVFIFQRTPAAPFERNNDPTPNDFGSEHGPGWQRRRMWNFTAVSAGYPPPLGEDDMVHDGWTKIAQSMARAAIDPAKGREAGDLEVMECIRARIGTTVRDPVVAAALKPYYRFGCKRPIFHDHYLNSFNRDNVHLVDTNGRGPDEITESAVIVDGHAYELDCLVYATGFDLGMGFLYGTELNIVGLGGEVLAEKWSKGMRTFHGMVSCNFPNLFCVGYTQTAFSMNYTHMALEQTQHVAHVVAEAERRGAIVEATAEAEQGWVDTIRANQYTAFIEFFASCTPGSLNNEGRADDPNSAVAGQYLPAGNDFFELLHDWRVSGEFEGLRFTEAQNRVS